MKHLRILGLCLCLMMGLAIQSPHIAHAKGKSSTRTITYTIKKGDTLAKVAKKYKVSTADVERWNRKVNPERLQIGQEIKLVVSGSQVASKGSSKGKKGKKGKKSKEAAAPIPMDLDEELRVEAELAGADPDAADDAEVEEEDSEPGFKDEGDILAHAPGFDEDEEDDSALEIKDPSAEVSPVATAGMSGRDPLAGRDLSKGSGKLGQVITAGELSYYVATSEDTMGSIALRFGVELEELQHWNQTKSMRPSEGDRVVIKAPGKAPRKTKLLPVVHIVARGDTYDKIARRYNVSTKDLERWNPKVNPKRLKPRTKITMQIPSSHGRSMSWGTANRGKLYNGVALETSYGIRVRTVSNAYGTHSVVAMLKAAAADVKARWPESPDLVVGDISYRRGGRIKRHSSHQSGRDADISYYHRGNVQVPDFMDMDGATIDAAKTWHIFKLLIDTGHVEYLFVDYALQKQLYDYALSIGYTSDDLSPIFQYPRPRSASAGVIRHVKGHDDHWHIRFRCGADDTGCR
jgi:LysM repeat protein